MDKEIQKLLDEHCGELPVIPKKPLSSHAVLGEGAQKPPLGLKPERLHEEDRINEIIDALDRYIKHGKYNNDLIVLYFPCWRFTRCCTK